MKTEIIKVKKGTISQKKFKQVVKALQKGEPVVFPTDTVYGIGVNAFHYKGIKKIYRLKSRDFNKPLVWLIDSVVPVDRLVKHISLHARILMDHFWPGPLTLIFKASWISTLAEMKQDSLGLRIPRYALARNLIKHSGVPLATTSANRSGKISATRSSQLKVFSGKIPFILDAGTLRSTRESTVVDVTVTPPRIIREGAISRERLKRALNV